MTKPLQNYALDWLSFGLLVALAATGMMMAYALPPRHGGAAILGWDRHEWGEIHLWIAWGFLTTVALHLILHAGWIKAMTLGKATGAARVWRGIAAVGATALLIGVVVLGALAPSTPGAGDGEGRHRRDTLGAIDQGNAEPHEGPRRRGRD